MIGKVAQEKQPSLDVLANMLFQKLKAAVKGWLECEACKDVLSEVQPRTAMTAYHWNKEKQKEDPNRDVILCNPCHFDYVAHWTEMWKEYNSGRL